MDKIGASKSPDAGSYPATRAMKNYLNTETPTISADVIRLFENGKKEDILKAIENERRSKRGIGISNGIKVTRVGFY